MAATAARAAVLLALLGKQTVRSVCSSLCGAAAAAMRVRSHWNTAFFFIFAKLSVF